MVVVILHVISTTSKSLHAGANPGFGSAPLEEGRPNLQKQNVVTVRVFFRRVKCVGDPPAAGPNPPLAPPQIIAHTSWPSAQTYLSGVALTTRADTRRRKSSDKPREKYGEAATSWRQFHVGRVTPRVASFSSSATTHRPLHVLQLRTRTQCCIANT